MDNKHEGLPVSGYRSQSDENVAIVNENKVLEERVLRRVDALRNAAPEMGIDGRWLAIARTDIEQGFMALNRAIFQPGRISLPEDGE